MSISIVNGYVCFNCTDTERAGKGLDPAKSAGDPAAEKSSTQAPTGAADAVGSTGAAGGIASWSAYAAPGDAGASDTADPRPAPQRALVATGLGRAVDVFA